MVYNIENLKTKPEYLEELQDLHEELGTSFTTDTLIDEDELKFLTRIDEIMIILDFIDKKKTHYLELWAG